MSQAAFATAIEKVLGFEGGYVNDPADPGGETNFGISKRQYPHVDIRNLDRDAAIELYRRDYWMRPGYGDLPDLIAIKMLDMAVNMGIGTANRLLQRACNRFDEPPPLHTDGVIGRQTKYVVSRLDTLALLSALRNEARQHYVEIATANPSLRRFLNGWLRRAAS